MYGRGKIKNMISRVGSESMMPRLENGDEVEDEDTRRSKATIEDMYQKNYDSLIFLYRES